MTGPLGRDTVSDPISFGRAPQTNTSTKFASFPWFPEHQFQNGSRGCVFIGAKPAWALRVCKAAEIAFPWENFRFIFVLPWTLNSNPVFLAGLIPDNPRVEIALGPALCSALVPEFGSVRGHEVSPQQDRVPGCQELFFSTYPASVRAAVPGRGPFLLGRAHTWAPVPLSSRHRASLSHKTPVGGGSRCGAEPKKRCPVGSRHDSPV